MSEQRRKTLRSFYCEEDLWKSIMERAESEGVTLDALLNDALRTWLSGAVAAPAPQAASEAARPQVKAELPAPESRPAAPADHATLQRMPAVQAPAGRAPQVTPPPPPRVPPAPPRPPTGSQPAAAGPMPRLVVAYDGQTFPVEKERFIIGRGTQGTDLTIRDGNVSRKHATIIFHGGHFYLQDAGSTNGIEFQGNRIDTKKIEDGDIVHICDHELRFAIQG